MADAVGTKLTFKRRNVYNMMAVIFLAISTAFGFMFYTQTDASSIPAMVAPGGAPVYQRMLYGGFGEAGLAKAMDATVGGQYTYVTDAKSHRVQAFDASGKPVFVFGDKAPCKLSFPYGIAADEKGNVYVADLYDGGIAMFDAKGKFIKYFLGKKAIIHPGGLRIFGNKVYVTEITNSKVYVYDMTGKMLMEVGKGGTKPGELLAPNALTVDSDGTIYIVDTGNQRVEVFDKTGKFLKMFNGSSDGKGPSVLVNPRGIGIDSSGNILVVSNMTHTVFGFDKQGKQVFTFGGNGGETNKFSLPNGLFINSNGDIYVTDTINQRVAVYN